MMEFHDIHCEQPRLLTPYDMDLIQGSEMSIRLVRNKFELKPLNTRHGSWLELKETIENWLKAETSGKYYIQYEYSKHMNVFLDNDSDAVHFKLTFQS